MAKQAGKQKLMCIILFSITSYLPNTKDLEHVRKNNVPIFSTFAGVQNINISRQLKKQ